MSKEIPLAVPFNLKDQFKEKYGRAFRWNPKGKYWYWQDNSPLPEDLKPYLPAPPGSLKLTIELVPKSCWLSNVRNHVTRKQWDHIRQTTFRPTKHTCEICGGQGDEDQELVECHEVFHYDDEKHIQKLVRFMALCPECHRVKHFGFARKEGMERFALAHLCKINGWTRAKAQEYVAEQFEVWKQRSESEWKLDLSLLEQSFGIKIQTESPKARRERAQSFYDESYGDDYYEFPRGANVKLHSIEDVQNHLFHGGPEYYDEDEEEFPKAPLPVPAENEWLKLKLGAQKCRDNHLYRWLKIELSWHRMRKRH